MESLQDVNLDIYTKEITNTNLHEHMRYKLVEYYTTNTTRKEILQQIVIISITNERNIDPSPP